MTFADFLRNDDTEIAPGQPFDVELPLADNFSGPTLYDRQSETITFESQNFPVKQEKPSNETFTTRLCPPSNITVTQHKFDENRVLTSSATNSKSNKSNDNSRPAKSKTPTTLPVSAPIGSTFTQQSTHNYNQRLDVTPSQQAQVTPVSKGENQKEKTSKRKMIAAESSAPASKKVVLEVCDLKPSLHSDEETGDCKRMQRLLRNRASAQLSRERKKAYMKNLEAQVKELSNQNDALQRQLMQLHQENAGLRSAINKMEQNFGINHSPGLRARSSPSSPCSPLSTSSNAPSDVASPEFSLGPAASPQYGSPGQAAATGLVLLALVFSFAMIYGMVGAPLEGNSSNMPHFRSRVLNSVESSSSSPDVSDRASGASTPFAPQVSTAEQPKLPGPTPSGLLPDPADARPNKKRRREDDSSLALSVYQEPAPSVALDPLLAMNQLLLQANFTLDHNATYLLCPSAMPIKPNPNAKAPETETGESFSTALAQAKPDRGSVAVAHRLRKSVPNNKKTTSRLLLWLPTSSVLPTLAAFNMSPEMQAKHSGLTELSCEVQSIRPVLFT